MRKVTPDEILPLGAYEQVRDRFRARIIAHKRERRVMAGPEMSLLFEDHDTVLSQVQEMLRAERISAPAAVREEIDTYNDLVPPDGALLATLMIEVADPDERERRRRDLMGIDDTVSMVLGDVTVPGTFDALGRYEDRTAVVRYVTFQLPPDGRERLMDTRVPIRVVVDHPRYKATAALSEATRASLAADLDPENAEHARSPVRGEGAPT